MVTANDTSTFHLDPNTFRLVDDLAHVVWLSGTTIASGLIAATALVALRSGLPPKWVAWLSLVAAARLLGSFLLRPVPHPARVGASSSAWR